MRSTAGKCQADSREESDDEQGRCWSLPASQGRAVYLLLVGSLLTGNYDSTQSLGFPLNKGKAEELVLP